MISLLHASGCLPYLFKETHVFSQVSNLGSLVPVSMHHRFGRTLFLHNPMHVASKSSVSWSCFCAHLGAISLQGTLRFSQVPNLRSLCFPLNPVRMLHPFGRKFSLHHHPMHTAPKSSSTNLSHTCKKVVRWSKRKHIKDYLAASLKVLLGPAALRRLSKTLCFLHPPIHAILPHSAAWC